MERSLRSGSVVLVLLAGLVPGCVNVDLGPGVRRGELEEKLVLGEGGPKIALIELDGVISTEEERDALGLGTRESAVARVRAQLDRAAEDDQVRAVILRINSPGGTVTASDILHREILRFKQEQGIPVLAQLMGVATSGGYYVAMAADFVRAHPTTVTGSIGVILLGVNVSGLMEKLGIEDQTLKSGAYKDAGSPLRPMSEVERAQLQSVLDDLQARFVEVVAAGRPGLTRARVEALADGRVYSARQALENGLIDGIASLPDTVAEAERLAGLEQSRVVVYHRPREWRENLYTAPWPVPFGLDPGWVRGPVRGPAFLYLWWPG
jgi:protease-4